MKTPIDFSHDSYLKSGGGLSRSNGDSDDDDEDDSDHSPPTKSSGKKKTSGTKSRPVRSTTLNSLQEEVCRRYPWVLPPWLISWVETQH